MNAIVDDLITQVFCSDFKFYVSYARAGDLCVSIRWRDNGALRVAQNTYKTMET